jgi:hypothetical protein
VGPSTLVEPRPTIIIVLYQNRTTQTSKSHSLSREPPSSNPHHKQSSNPKSVPMDACTNFVLLHHLIHDKINFSFLLFFPLLVENHTLSPKDPIFQKLSMHVCSSIGSLSIDLSRGKYGLNFFLLTFGCKPFTVNQTMILIREQRLYNWA